MPSLKTKIGVVCALALVPEMAFAQINAGNSVGTTEAEIRAMLEAAGCTVSEVEQEDSLLEVATMYEGQEIEFELAANGTVAEIGLDD
jgi:outer membrane lipopolysaccharide assembly protein LptE/RlpB